MKIGQGGIWRCFLYNRKLRSLLYKKRSAGIALRRRGYFTINLDEPSTLLYDKKYGGESTEGQRMAAVLTERGTDL